MHKHAHPRPHLRHVDDHHAPFGLVPEHIIFGQVPVHQLARVVHGPHVQTRLPVGLCQLFARQLRILQTGRRPAVLSHEFHHQNVVLEQDRLRRRHARGIQATQVAHFFLGPRFHHLARVRLAVAVPVPKLAAHVSAQWGRLVGKEIKRFKYEVKSKE